MDDRLKTHVRSLPGIAWFCIIAVTALFTCGCVQSLESNPHLRLVAGRPLEPDVPIPAGFVMVDQASEDRSTGSSRLYLRHVYEGRADKYAIRNFYRQEMPLSRWTRVSDGNIKGVINMRFEKGSRFENGSESCTVTISDGSKTYNSGVLIQVVIAREERGQAPPYDKTRPHAPLRSNHRTGNP